jgi:hypothetical protein
LELSNSWSKPEGWPPNTPPKVVLYWIMNRFTGVREVHKTERAFDSFTESWHLSLAAQDQRYADESTALIQQACGYFYLDDAHYTPLEGVPDIVVSDDEVTERVRRLDLGENTRETLRVARFSLVMKNRYPLQELPWSQQRALVEQLLDLKRRWQVEIIGEDENDVPPAFTVAAAPSATVYVDDVDG